MLLSSVRFRNYACFLDTGNVSLSERFNLVLGRNNSGKSAFLAGIADPKVNNPHRGLGETANQSAAPKQQVTLTFRITAKELCEQLLRSENRGLRHHASLPMGLFKNEDITGFSRASLEGKVFEVSIDMDSNGILSPVRVGGDVNPLERYVSLFVDASDQIRIDKDGSYSPLGPELVKPLISNAITRFWYFKPQEAQVKNEMVNAQSELSPNLSNLASVIDKLQSNPNKFSRYLDEIRKVLPEVVTIDSRTVESGTKSVFVWFHDQKTERPECAFRLDACGTGIRTVLGLLYVAIASDTPRTLLVDEIHSFLHPGCLRDLIHSLMQVGGHQLIASTHSPVLIGTPEVFQFIHIVKDQMVSSVQSVDAAAKNDVEMLLADLGVRLSDVFGADRVFWVEGRTEEKCIPRILRKLKPDELIGTVVLGVRSTSEFTDKKIIETTVEIYSKLSGLSFVMPRRVAFLFDSEGKKAEELSDLQRRPREKVSFLKRPMFEDYLLHAGAIAEVINANSEATKVSQEDCRQALNNSTTVKGDKKLKEVFRQLSEGTLEFRKTLHAPEIVEWLLENEPGYLTPLAEEIAAALSPRG